MRSIINTSLLLILLLTACGPVYQTTFSYTPPGDLAGNRCANDCQNTQQYCESAEQERFEVCQSRVTHEYNLCESRKIYQYDRKKRETECVANCYCYEESCPEPNLTLCTERYNSCYLNCGGTVVATTQCTSSCEKADPPKTEIIKGARLD